MFLNNLSFQQRKVFLGLAKKMLEIDGGIDEEEENYLRSICKEMSLGLKDDVQFTIEELNDIYHTPEERKVILVELFALAFSNGEYHELEEKLILSIIDTFDMEKADLKNIEKLIEQFFSTQKEIIDFIAPEEI